MTKSSYRKIDVDGLELAVIEGGRSWLNRSNLFVIEVHEEPFLDRLRALFAGFPYRPPPLQGFTGTFAQHGKNIRIPRRHAQAGGTLPAQSR